MMTHKKQNQNHIVNNYICCWMPQTKCRSHLQFSDSAYGCDFRDSMFLKEKLIFFCVDLKKLFQITQFFGAILCNIVL